MMEQMTKDNADGVVDVEVPLADGNLWTFPGNSIMRDFLVGHRGKVISEYHGQR